MFSAIQGSNYFKYHGVGYYSNQKKKKTSPNHRHYLLFKQEMHLLYLSIQFWGGEYE